jgi:Pyruvate/2-oxoacid:ferredoxin oxidoreductase delta subunit
MLLTLGVKNIFGCVVGMNKPKWHFRSGVDREVFARLLVQIYRAVSPSITLLDGILALEGQGPGRSGNPRQLGVLAGSANAAALDAAVCNMLGIDPARLPTHRAAKKVGLIGETLHVNGEFHMLEGFGLPELGPLVFGPKPLHGLIRRHLVQRPVADRRLCRLCGECWRYCPAQAIRQGRKKLDVDYDRCIRCYCCIEVCPHGALRAVETLPGRLLRLLPQFKA